MQLACRASRVGRPRCGDEGQTLFCKIKGVICPRKSIAPLLIGIIPSDPTFKTAFMDGADFRGVPVWQHINRAPIDRELKAKFDLVWLGERSVEEAARAAMKKVDELLVEID